MKRTTLIGALAAFAIATSCSSTKTATMAQQEVQTPKQTHKISYGPGGKIITAEEVESAAELTVKNATVTTEIETSAPKVANKRKEIGTNYLNKVGKVAGKVNKNAEREFKSLRNRAKHQSVIYKHFDKTTDFDDMGNPRNNGLAVAGFVSGIVGLFLFGLILGLIALIFGAIGISSQRRGFAVAAIILGMIDIVGALLIASTL